MTSPNQACSLTPISLRPSLWLPSSCAPREESVAITAHAIHLKPTASLHHSVLQLTTAPLPQSVVLLQASRRRHRRLCPESALPSSLNLLQQLRRQHLPFNIITSRSASPISVQTSTLTMYLLNATSLAKMNAIQLLQTELISHNVDIALIG